MAITYALLRMRTANTLQSEFEAKDGIMSFPITTSTSSIFFVSAFFQVHNV